MDVIKHEWSAVSLRPGCLFVKQQNFGESAKLVATTGTEDSARMIAAAPDMLDALRAIITEVEGPLKPFSADSYLPRHLIDLIAAAIDKAEGGAIESAKDVPWA